MSNSPSPKIHPITSASVASKRVLLRTDLNLPLTPNGEITDLTRLRRLVPSITDLTRRGTRLIIISHLGRPKGKPDPKLSLEGVAQALTKILNKQVRFISTLADAPGHIKALPPGEIALLENLRFHPGETTSTLSQSFAKTLASLADLYVNDAFACSHRAHASLVAITDHLPSYAGSLLTEELAALSKTLTTPARPLVAIIGGGKISTKLGVLSNLAKQTDRLVIGGAMANNFLAARGIGIGASLYEADMGATSQALIAQAKPDALLLPEDAIVAPHLTRDTPTRLVRFAGEAESERVGVVDETESERAGVAGDEMILDIGDASIAAIKTTINQAKTLIWNGPLGAFETPPFDRGSIAIARHVATRTKQGKLISVAGGGDTIALLATAGVMDDFTYVSTAGGAFLEWMEGKPLPGVEALRR
ncbi:MAG: phosphoglycerate kinase [Proteobacteria bacterium]|nr:phosphoglycerate kinase [Pseudomonadota bacterium]